MKFSPGEHVVYYDGERDVVAVVAEGRPSPDLPYLIHITWPGHAANVWVDSVRLATPDERREQASS